MLIKVLEATLYIRREDATEQDMCKLFKKLRNQFSKFEHSSVTTQNPLFVFVNIAHVADQEQWSNSMAYEVHNVRGIKTQCIR